MSQIHSALAYYWDHQTELDIERRVQYAIQLHQLIAVGDCIRDLEIIAKASDPEDLANRVKYIPL
jgi:hypothetical protein